MQQIPALSLSPSFNCYSSDKLAEAAAKVSEEFIEESKLSVSDNKTEEEPPPEQSSNDQLPQNQSDEDDDDGFEFAFVYRDHDASPVPADEIFYNGQIRPVFPIFNRDLLLAGGHDGDSKAPKPSSIRLPLRKLLIEDRDSSSSSSSSEAEELERIPEGTYCIWTPAGVQASPDRCKKSNSTGSSKRWRFRDLMRRSNSDGKDSFVFLAPSNSFLKTKKKDEKAEKVEKPEVPKSRRNSSEVNLAGKMKAKGISGEAVSAHEIHYVRNRALKEGDRRRSYLPYRQDLVGFFANANGLSRDLRPF